MTYVNSYSWEFPIDGSDVRVLQHEWHAMKGRGRLLFPQRAS